MNKINILGIEFSLGCINQIISEIDKCINNKKQIYIVTPNPEHVVYAQADNDFKKIINQADISIIDGIGIILAYKIQKIKNILLSRVKTFNNIDVELSRITGVDLTKKILNYSSDKKLIVGVLGTYRDVVDKFLAVYNVSLPNLKIIYVGGHKQIRSYSAYENSKIISLINNNKINVLLVAYGAPHQEKWIFNNKNKLKTVRVLIGVGGTIDYLSGYIARAPIVIRKLGFEWLFRLIKQPWRFKRQLKLLKFIELALKYKR